MITANLRGRLTREDATIASRLLAGNDPRALRLVESRIRDDGLDAVLDDAALAPALLTRPLGWHASPALFWYVVVRHALVQAGAEERALADYVAAVLLEFGARGRATRISASDDEVYDTLAQLLADAERGAPARRLLAQAHLGNYALWISGVFPDFVTYRHANRGGPDFDYYETMGRTGFQLAAEARAAADYGMDDVFARAAERFSVIRVALNGISDRLMFRGSTSVEALERRVSQPVWRLS
jgi:hypothetical protein